MAGEVLSVIRKLAAEGHTMLIVTHEMQFARDVSTRVLFMDEGTIYEEGTPEQIFDHPRREKTRAFIRRIHVFFFEAMSKDFDYLQLNSSIEEFGQKQALSHKQIITVQLVFEELIMGLLLPHISDEEFYLEFTLEYARQIDELAFHFVYGGAPFNPMEDYKDTLSAVLIAQKTHKLSYRYEDGINHILCCS